MSLWQYQCQQEGSLFYYQHGSKAPPDHILECCPICGSKRIRPIRKFPDLDEQSGQELNSYLHLDELEAEGDPMEKAKAWRKDRYRVFLDGGEVELLTAPSTRQH